MLFRFVDIYEKLWEKGYIFKKSIKQGRPDVELAARIVDKGFFNYDLILFLEEMGIKLSYEKDRVYPQNQSAQKLVNVLTDKLKKQNIRVNLNEKMADIIIKDGMVIQISTDKVDYFLEKDFTHVVLASGGLSYNKNNSFDILKNKVKITPLYPSLVAVNTLNDFSNDRDRKSVV